VFAIVNLLPILHSVPVAKAICKLMVQVYAVTGVSAELETPKNVLFHNRTQISYD
jgi:hypothetical protein